MVTAAFRGDIDLDRVEAGALRAAVLGDGAFEAPGVTLLWDAARAAFARDGAALCVCTGRPRFVDSDLAAQAQDNAAAAWLVAYAQHGPAAVQRVRGSYAVAIVDAAARRAWLAVDRFAVQTLCYALEGKRLRFADRADAVATQAARIDPQGILDYLYFHVVPAPRTIFAGVQRLDAAHALHATGAAAQVERHWAPRFVENARGRFDTLREEFVALLRDAVAREIDPGRTGSFLSGGTDSSTIAGLVGRLSGARPRTYSIGFDAAGYDEMAYARIAARAFDADHHEYYVTPDDLVEGIPAVAAYHDQPFGNSSAAPAYYCARLAHDDGVTRLLAGDGGDELFGGNSRYATQRLLEPYHRLPEALRRRVLEPWFADSRVLRAIPGLRQATGYIRHARPPMPDRLQSFNLIGQLGIDNVLQPQLAAAVDAAAPLAQQQAVYGKAQARALINRMLAFDWKYTLADSDLPKVRGAVDMARVAVAFPLLSDELVDFSLRLHPSLKLRGLTLRYFFKKALSDLLPPQIIAKKKHGFGLPFGPWMTRHEPLRVLARDALQGGVERGITSGRFVTRLLDELVPSQPSYYGEMVWILMMLELWMRAHAPSARF